MNIVYNDLSTEQFLTNLMTNYPRSDWNEILQQVSMTFAESVLDRKLANCFQLDFKADESSESHCPGCDAELQFDYDSLFVMDDNRTSEDWDCPECGCHGTMFMQRHFDGHRVKNISPRAIQKLMSKQENQ